VPMVLADHDKYEVISWYRCDHPYVPMVILGGRPVPQV